MSNSASLPADSRYPDFSSTVIVSAHAERRFSQRGISLEAVRLTLTYGTRIEQDGARVFFLGRRHVPAIYNGVASRLEGTVVVVSRDGTVLTAFRRHRLPRKWRRRQRR